MDLTRHHRGLSSASNVSVGWGVVHFCKVDTGVLLFHGHVTKEMEEWRRARTPTCAVLQLRRNDGGGARPLNLCTFP